MLTVKTDNSALILTQPSVKLCK